MGLIVYNPPTIRKPASTTAIRDLLLSRVGEEISVTAGKTAIFLYAATADAARTAERTAQEVLAEKTLVADIRLERWDLSHRAWVDVRTGQPDHADAPDLPSGHPRNPGRRRPRLAGSLIAAIIEAIGKSPWPS